MQNVGQIVSGAILKSKREELGLTQRQLAKKIGVTTTSISQWESDRRNPRFVRLQQLKKALGIETTWYDSITKTSVKKTQVNFLSDLVEQEYTFTL